MRHTLPLTPQFYVTAPQPCPYLEGRLERKLFTALQGENAAELNDSLSGQGFRRSQNVLYRPSCADCASCLSARIDVSAFKPSRSQRRTINRNAGIERRATSPWATEEQYDLFRRYLDSRHADGGMADMDVFEFAAMIEETPIRSRVIEYTVPETKELVGVCLTDVLKDGVSMVYSFYGPDRPKDGLGNYMILDHIEIARKAGLPYVYLGYWVPGSQKMGYKAKFSGLEVYLRGECKRSTTPNSFVRSNIRWAPIRSPNKSQISPCPTWPAPGADARGHQQDDAPLLGLRAILTACALLRCRVTLQNRQCFFVSIGKAEHICP